MKTLLLIISFILPSLAFGLSASEKTEFKVYGACGMCEARIEKAAKIEGVETADWSQETKMLTLTYDADQVDLRDVHQSIADAGHDTEEVKAKDATYEKLPACCHYERKADDQTGQLLKSSGNCYSH